MNRTVNKSTPYISDARMFELVGHIRTLSLDSLAVATAVKVLNPLDFLFKCRPTFPLKSIGN